MKKSPTQEQKARLKRLVEAKEKLGLSQVGISEVVGINPRTVRYYFEGRAYPAEPTVRLLEEHVEKQKNVNNTRPEHRNKPSGASSGSKAPKPQKGTKNASQRH